MKMVMKQVHGIHIRLIDKRGYARFRSKILLNTFEIINLFHKKQLTIASIDNGVN